jgi:2'-5' RNA ligase
LAGQLQTGLHLAGLRSESRHFKPHVTLARNIAVVGPALPVWPVLEWQAPAIALVRSRLAPEGADYAVLSRWPLC